jgi:Family of unknown function (DUF6444)
MSAVVSRAKRQEPTANRHGHSDQSNPAQLQRENERLPRENDDLRRKVTERDKRIADAGKQIADLERQLSWRKKNSTNSSKPPSSDGLAGGQRPRGRKSWRKISFGNRSRNGEIATARLLTVSQTCKLQRRHVLGYLTEAVKCRGGREDRAHEVNRTHYRALASSI